MACLNQSAFASSLSDTVLSGSGNDTPLLETFFTSIAVNVQSQCYVHTFENDFQLSQNGK
jgi:hypothetical protein